jgi:hypothetical protein
MGSCGAEGLVTEIYLDVETQRLSSEVQGGWNNIRAFGVSVAVTWDEPAGFRDWYEADVPPALVHALLAGDQYGLLLDDEKGQTQTRHVLSSREGAHPPVLVIEGTRSDRIAPGRVRIKNTGRR